MTDTEKATQLGTVLMEIKRHEAELAPLLAEARRIGAVLRQIGEGLEVRPFGVESADRPVTAVSVAGGTYGGQKHFFDYEKLEKLERDIQEHVRELQRLRSLRSQLGF